MTDRGNDKVEHILDAVLDYYYDMKSDIKDVIGAGLSNGVFGKVCKAALIVCLVLAVFPIYSWAIQTNRVSVVTDTSVGIKTQYYDLPRRIKTVEAFIKEYDLSIGELDITDIRNRDKITDGLVINIKKPITVSVVHDGITDYVTMQEDRVSDALEKLGLTLGEYDKIEPETYEKVCDRDQIVIKRITFEFVEDEADTNYHTVYKADPNMTIGKTKVTQKGVTGVKVTTYMLSKEDGKVISKSKVGTETVAKEKDKVISYGTKILSGVPKDLKYVKKLSHVRAVSYYFSGNPHGAYGLKCEYGTCAVDKSVIPLGSLIYVEGYGYAIANDVGSGVKGKTVDLYMEKLSQCGIWGARWVNVYIVRYGP